MTVDPAYLRDGLMRRGLPQHVADAFVMNFRDESGLNPGINEIAPIVPGSRGGYGLYQLTGPRRVAYERFAQERGVNLADPDAQMDFLMMELQGPEARAAQRILAAPDTGTAAAAIVRDFLRPAPEHRDRRTAQYLGGKAPGTNALAAPPQAPQEAPQNALEPFRMADMRQDPAAFMRSRNALAMAPVAVERQNILARYV